jgi:hypothetical protein
MNCACENQLEEIIECRRRGAMQIDKMLRQRDRHREGTCLARKGDRQRQPLMSISPCLGNTFRSGSKKKLQRLLGN